MYSTNIEMNTRCGTASAAACYVIAMFSSVWAIMRCGDAVKTTISKCLRLPRQTVSYDLIQYIGDQRTTRQRTVIPPASSSNGLCDISGIANNARITVWE